MINLLRKLKEAYALGYERAGLRVDIYIIFSSIKNGNTMNQDQIPKLREKIAEIDKGYSNLGFLERLALMKSNFF